MQLDILLQVALVLFVWLSVVPLSTCWLWRLGFTRSLTEVRLVAKVHPTFATYCSLLCYLLLEIAVIHTCTAALVFSEHQTVIQHD